MPSIEEFVDAGLEGGEPTHFLDETEESGRVTVVFEAGMKCEPKRLYPKYDSSRYVEWVDEIPDKVTDQAYGYSDAWKEYALLLRTNLEQGEHRLHSIIIQSPLLKSKLNLIFDDYPGFFIGENKSSIIEEPFAPFVHCWDAFTKSCDEKSETGKHLQLLRSALEPELQGSFSTIKEFQSRGMIRFDQLWMIFKPGSFVFSEHSGIERTYKLGRSELRNGTDYTSKYFLLHSYYIDWDGGMHGNALDIDGIEIFEGSKKYTDLGIYPLDIHPEKAAVVERLVARGRKFSSYTGVHYLAYDGLATNCEFTISPVGEHVSGRVVIDTETFMHFHPFYRQLIQRLGTKETKIQDPDGDYSQPDTSYTSQNIYRNAGTLTEQAIFSANKRSAEMEQTELTEDLLMICCSTVRGYSLSLNQWSRYLLTLFREWSWLTVPVNFQVDLLRDIEWNADAFESLALPGNHKELLLAFAQTQGDSAAQFDDVIEGKGKGMVVLLEGPPGLGKTLTVESLAEKMRVPIYRIASGQIRPAPDAVKAVLQDAFLMTKAWKGIILLDEADIFLERRSVNDLDRNQLVSVFLQHLEYFEGTIFLTTNRVECIDPAFESRIHLSLSYPELTRELRHKIWKNFVRTLKVDTFQITDAHLDKFAAIDMNGRQIKNTVKMAGLLATNANHSLTAEHVEMMLAIGQSK